MAKKFFEGLWDKISGAEQYRLEQEELERQRQQKEAAARREEQARQQRINAQRLSDFKDEVYMCLYQIEQKIQAGYNDPTEDYKPVKALEKTAQNNGWMKEYGQLMANHCHKLCQIAISGIKTHGGLPGLCEALSAMSCYKYAIVESEKSKVERAADAIYQTILTACSTLCYLSYDSYSECRFPLDAPEKMRDLDVNADAIMERLLDAEEKLQELNDANLCERIAAYLNPQLIQDSCMMMWFYAKKWPFDVNKFEKARKLYISHTAYLLPDPKNEDVLVDIGPVEEVLARVYAKNRIGGIGTARQEKGYIDLWIEKRFDLGDFDPCYGLAHGLAWMELYEIEIEVLRQLINAGADVPAELQDRLTFLESGGTAEIKVYDIEPFDNIYFFDSSVCEWTGKDLSTFFRKIAMKKTKFKYSLAMTKWTKTLPLASGQKISYERIISELKNLSGDFDGEVNCEVRNAAAINLSNVVFPNAVLFTFNSMRNQCVDILFYCEKFGRNLNITIFTLFTPDYQLDFEELEKYCLAIKDNMYVESFRESILQVVDEAIKVKQIVYDEDDTPRKRMVFDE